MVDTAPGARQGKARDGWNSSLRSLFSLVMVAMLIVVSATLVGLDYHRSRNAAIADAEANMRGFMNRLVDRLGVLSGDTSALVNLVSSVANSFLVPPPERMNDKVAVLREGITRSPHIDGVYVGYPNGAFFQVVDLKQVAWRMALDAPRGAAIAVRSMERTQTASRSSAFSSSTRTARNSPNGGYRHRASTRARDPGIARPSTARPRSRLDPMKAPPPKHWA